MALAAAKVVTFSPEYERSHITDTNTDLFPKDEFLVGESASPLNLSQPQRGFRVVMTRRLKSAAHTDTVCSTAILDSI